MASKKDIESNRALLQSLGYSFDDNNNITRKVRLEDDDEEYYISVEALNAINNGTINTYRPKSDGEARAIRALAKPKPTVTPGSAGKLVGEALTKNLPKSSRVSPTAPYSRNAPSFLRLTSAEKNHIKNPTETREDKVRKLAGSKSKSELEYDAKNKRQFITAIDYADDAATMLMENFTGTKHLAPLVKTLANSDKFENYKAKKKRDLKLYEDALTAQAKIERKKMESEARNRGDFEQFSKFDKTVSDEKLKNELHDSNSFYNYVNAANVNWDANLSLKYAKPAGKTNVINSGEDYLKNLYANWMTDDERATYNATLKQKDETSANKYLELITPELEKRKAEYTDAAWAEDASNNKWAAAGANLLLTLGNITGIVETYSKLIKGEKIETTDKIYDVPRAKTAMQKGITQGDGEVVSFLKQTGMSMADSALGMIVSTLMGMPGAGLAILGTNAASTEAYNVLENGGTPQQALESGVASGLIEVITEKIPMDEFFKLAKTPAKKGIKRFLDMGKKAAKQSGIEGAEEFIAEILNNIANGRIMGDQSEFNKYVSYLKDNGDSDAEATTKAYVEFYVKRPIKAAFGGALSGFGFGVIGAGMAPTENTSPKKPLPPTTEVKETVEVKKTETKQKLPVSTEGGIQLPKKAKRGNIEIDSTAKENITAELNETVATAEAKNNLYNSILRRLISASERYGVDEGELLEVMTTEINNPQELKDISQKVNTLFENQANFKRKDLPGKRYLYNSDDVKAALYKLSWLADNYETVDSTPAVENIPQNVVENSETVIESPAHVISQPENVVEEAESVAEIPAEVIEQSEEQAESSTPTYEEFRDAINRAYPDVDENLIRQAYDEQFPTLNPNGEVKLEYINSVPEHLQRSVDAIKNRTGIEVVTGNRYVDGKIDPNFRGFFDGERIVVSANATEQDVFDAVVLHELTHGIEKTSQYQSISDVVIGEMFKGDESALQKAIDDKIAEYKGFGKEINSEEAKAEIVASNVQKYIFADDVQSIVNSNYTFAQKIYDIINELIYNINQKYGGTLFNLDELKAAQRRYRMALEEYKGQRGTSTLIDADRITRSELDVKYSLQHNDDISQNQIKYTEQKKSYVTPEELADAQEATKAMVDVMMEHSSILPEDKIGKVLTKNGAYDRSVENTTICVRTLAYNEFVDKVQEELGRPLTQMESFLVSQKLYDIATDPQCLYCYVSLDRKSYNEMLLRYMNERDTVIAKYNESDKSPETVKSLYEEFRRGRKDTDNMKKRFNNWLDYADNGTPLLSLADIATEDRQRTIQAEGGNLAQQLSDARAYAQSASWAKIQKDYVAYRDEILKLGDRVVNNLNQHYGLRWYSFSDYSAAFIVENMQQITDAAIRGLKGLSYTKDTDFAEIFAPSGMNINISVFVNRDENGNFYIDEKQSADFEKALDLRKRYPNVGIVATVTDDEALVWAGEQEWTDVIIPFHIVRTGTDVAQFYKWLNYTNESSDTVGDKDLWEAYVDSLNPKTENARRKVSKNIYPNEHKNDKDTYLNLCQSRGLTPRFARFAGEDWYMKLVNETRLSADQSKPLKPKYNLDAAEESFQKFIDKGGYNEGWYKEGVDVEAEAKKVAEDVLAGKRADEVDYGRQDNYNPENIMASRKSGRTHGQYLFERFKKPSLKNAVESFGKKYATNEMKKHSRRDTNYLNAVESGDMETAQRMVDEAAKKAGAVTDNSGNTKHNYHGTVDNFNSFEAEKSRRGTYGFGFYFANHKGLAQNFANYQSKKNDRPATIKDVYIMTNKFATRNDHKITAEQVSRFAQMYGLKLNKNTFGYTDSIEEWVSNANDSSILVALQEYVQKQSDYDTKTLLKDLGDVFGYDGIKDSDETVLWNNRLVKLADPVTYDDNGDVIPLSKRFDTRENEDTRYLFERFKKPSLKNAVESFGKEYVTNETPVIETVREPAPTFYSHMGKVIDDMKQDKIGANSVVPYLKGRGVKDEEIKWSGIEELLEGKKSVTKAELQAIVAGTMLEIDEDVLSGNPTTQAQIESIKPLEKEKNTLVKDLKKLWKKTFGKDITVSNFDTRTFDEVFNDFLDVAQRENDVWDISSAYQLINMAQKIATLNKKILDTYTTRWENYSLPGGKNYREILFRLPESNYTNDAMGVHWQGKTGILAHARIQDFDVDGQKMLFIEEIQSDWHNEGAKKGYIPQIQDSRVQEIQDSRVQKAIDLYKQMHEPGIEHDEYFRLFEMIVELKFELEMEGINIRDYLDDQVPDAPFKDNYHEYVLKRLIRMAAEQGYDSIGWTPADIQSERWSDEYAEGYRIEYDQNIPKFLNKYGKKWGSRVGTTNLDGKEVWSMPITEEMKESVIYEGQPLYLFSAQDMEKAVSDFGKKHGYTPKATAQKNKFTDEEGVEYTRIDDIDDSFGVKILEGKTEYGQRKLKIDLNIPDYEGIYNSDEYKRIIENAGDIGNVKGTTLTAERAFEKAFGKLYKDFDKVVYENLDNSKLQYMAVLDYLRNDLENNVISRGIKKGSKDSALLQMYGEKVITLEELKGETKNWRNIVEADIYMRSMYDALIDSINDTKKKIYPNIEAQETALHEELAETERKLDLIEQGELLGLLPISKGDKLQRARYLEKAIENMRENSRNSMESIDNKISAVKEQLDSKKNKHTKVYAELSIRLSNLEAKRERLKGFFEMSEEIKKKQLDALLKEYGSADEMHEGIRQSVRDNLNEQRNDIVEKLGDELRWRGKRIPKRKDYYRHFQEVSNSILGELLSKKNGNISAELVLTSHSTKPKAKWESFAQRRRGTDTVYDAVGGYLDYIDAAAYAMSIDPNISVIRKLTDDLIYETSSSNKETYGTNNANATIQRLDALANELAGKTVSSVDRIVQDNIGRKNFKIVKKVIKLLKAASIVGNVGSAIVQVSNLPNAIGTLKNKATIIPAIGDGLSELKNGNNNFYDALMNRTEAQNKSTFLRERYFDSKSKFDTGILANAEKLGNWMLSVGDEMSTRLSWNAFYREGKKLGVENPVRYADSKTRKAVGGRGLGEKSMVQQSATMTAALPFTLEVSNAWQVQKDLARVIKEDVSRQDLKSAMKGVGNFLTLYIGNAVIATALGAIRGSDGGVFNPVGIIFENVWNEIFGSDEEDEENFFMETGKEILGNFVSSLPAGQFAASFLDDDVREDIFGDEDPLRYGDSNLFGNMVNKGYHMLKDRDVDSAVDFASTVIPGGAQMRKSYNAAKILKNGGVYSDGGELKYPVERNAENYVKGLLFGKSAFDETKAYYDNEATTLTEEETREYEYRIKQGEKPQTVYDDIYQQKKERGKKTAESKAFYEEAEKSIEPVDYEVSSQVNKAYNEYKKIDPDAYGIGFPEAQREFSYKVGNGKAKKYELTAEQYAELQNMYNKRYAEKIEKTLKAPMTTEKKYEALSKKRKEAIKEVKREFYYKHFGN